MGIPVCTLIAPGWGSPHAHHPWEHICTLPAKSHWSKAEAATRLVKSNQPSTSNLIWGAMGLLGGGEGGWLFRPDP